MGDPKPKRVLGFRVWGFGFRVRSGLGPCQAHAPYPAQLPASRSSQWHAGYPCWSIKSNSEARESDMFDAPQAIVAYPPAVLKSHPGQGWPVRTSCWASRCTLLEGELRGFSQEGALRILKIYKDDNRVPRGKTYVKFIL